MVRRAVDAHAVIVAVRPQRVRAKEARLEVDRNWRLAGQHSSQGVENRPCFVCKAVRLSGSPERSISQRFRTTAKRASDDATRTGLRPTRANRRVDRSVASHPNSDHLTDTATGARGKHPRGGGYSSQREFGGSHEQETPHGRGAQRRVVRPLAYPKNPAVPEMRSRGIILPPTAHTPTFHARVPVISRFIFSPGRTPGA